MMPLHRAILQTLLYYDLWEHPLTLGELHAFLPCEAGSLREFSEFLAREGPGQEVTEHDGYFFLRSRAVDVVASRRSQEELARKRWKIARFSCHIIKRFPFVRGVFVSGDLSKNVATPESDIDFVVVTVARRLWISRTLLMLFKKIVLLDSRKFFCLNTFAGEDSLYFEEHNLYAAMEVATLKPLYGTSLFHQYLEANRWIKEYFPNFHTHGLTPHGVDNRRSIVQRAAEFLLSFFPLDTLETLLLKKMKQYWIRKYPQFDNETRRFVFRSTRGESRAYVGNYQGGILQRYQERLRRFGILEEEPAEAGHALVAAEP